MDNDQLVQQIIGATRKVFETMLGVGVSPRDQGPGPETFSPEDRVVALVGLAGARVGAGSVLCSGALARTLTGKMLMMDCPAAVNTEVLDAVGEIANMIVGSIKSDIEQRCGPIGLSTPTVVYGRDLVAHSVGQQPWTIVAFSCLEDQLLVQVYLAPDNAGHPPMVLTPRIS